MQVGKAKFVTITDAEFTALCDKWHTNAHVAKCENHVMQAGVSICHFAAATAATKN